MEKKFKFSDKPTAAKAIYIAVIAILCVSAIIIGIVAANRKPTEDPTPPTNDGENNGNTGDDGEGNNGGDDNTQPAPEPKLTFVSPVGEGVVLKSHSATTPVFSNTLDEWRIHTGMDISVAEGDEVCAAEAGKVSAIYNHPMMGVTVEITHDDSHKTVYSNLNNDTVKVTVGDEVRANDVIACVGESAIIEIADEPHLHFELMVDGVSVNPLDYITEESQETSLGIVSGNEA